MATPSESSSGKRWLSNFAESERDVAELLLNSIRFLSESTFRAGLTEQLLRVASDASSWPLAIYPVHPVIGQVTASSTGVTTPRARTYPFGAPFSYTGAGSELICSNIITEVVKAVGSSSVLGPIDANQLRACKVRTIVFVSDYVGSGREALKFIQAWWAEPTIKSWYSGQHVRAELVTYALSTRGRAELAAAPAFLRATHHVEFGLDFEAASWTEQEAHEIRALCHRYASVPAQAFGFKKSCGLLAMGHTLPNNLPIIVRQNTGPGHTTWQPFLPPGRRRLSPQQQTQIQDHAPTIGAMARMSAIGADNLIPGLTRRTPSQIESDIIAVLAAVAKGHRRPNEIAEVLAFTTLHAAGAIGAAVKLGLLVIGASETSTQLTDAGRLELRRLRVRGRRPPLPALIPSSDPYYPQTLR